MAQMPTVNPYQSDVRAMSDAEIETLDGELCEAYRGYDYHGESWSDDHAETRHYEFAVERWRRFMLANPSYKPPMLSALVRDGLDAISESFLHGRGLASQFESRHKIGDTIEFQKPPRFLRHSVD